MPLPRPSILHVITGLQVGGAEMMLVKTLPALKKYDHTVCVLLGDGPLAAPLREGGVRVVVLDLRRHPLRGLITFWRLCRKRPSLLISYLIHADLFTRFLAPLFGVKRRICFIRNNLIGSKYHRLLQIERATQRLVQGYFSVSQSVVDAYIRELRYPAKKMTVIANGLIPDPIIKAQPLSRAELGAAEGVPLVLMVGKFFAQKGHRYLIEAWPAVQRAFPTARLLLAGGGPLEGEIRVQVKKRGFEGQIQFLGVRSDIPRLLKTADVFVFPTLFEGMSNALLEAMLAGCAIVTTDIPENREIVTDDEVLFVPPANSEKLAEALVALLNDQARQKRMGACAKQRVQRDFLIDRTIATLDAAYQKALAA